MNGLGLFRQRPPDNEIRTSFRLRLTPGGKQIDRNASPEPGFLSLKSPLPLAAASWDRLAGVCRSLIGHNHFRRWLCSYGGSIFLHAVLLLLLAWLVVPGVHSDGRAAIETKWEPLNDSELVKIEPPAVERPSEAQPTAGGAAQLKQLFPLQAQKTSKLIPTVTATTSVVADPWPTTDLTEQVLSGEAGSGDKSGQGTGNGQGAGAGAGSFFGTKAEGRSIVYVVDCSGSMLKPHSQAPSRFEYVRQELDRSVRSLTRDMKFFVIFFHRVHVPMPSRKLQTATRRNREHYLKWAKSVLPGHGTDPSMALLLALQLEPDAIYLLSDGAFDRRIGTAVTQHNEKKVTIHTFGIGDTGAESVLEYIAEYNNGVYRFIP